MASLAEASSRKKIALLMLGEKSLLVPLLPSRTLVLRSELRRQACLYHKLHSCLGDMLSTFAQLQEISQLERKLGLLETDKVLSKCASPAGRGDCSFPCFFF